MVKITEVTSAISEREGKYLIARRKGKRHLAGKWEFPGGTVEEGETPKECLRRELKEELGREFVVGGFLMNQFRIMGTRR